MMTGIYVIIALILILLGIKLFSGASQAYKDYQHWDGIIDSNVGNESHASFVLQFVFGLCFVAGGIMILAVTL